MTDPLNLASADDFPIDPALDDEDDDGLFLPVDEKDGHPSTAEHDQSTQYEIDEATASAINASLAEASKQVVQSPSQDQMGDESRPIMNPIVHSAPFSRPNRDESTPHPQYLVFSNRAEFELWLEGESSWCHYVQRRTTTPEKRAEERLRARIKAHERTLAAMTEEEAATAPPLKKRRRLRTSPIQEKVTFTCHHAGSYESKHSTTLPSDKLRMNTKKSVKCNCNSRIVLTEMQNGEAKAVYFWKHEGHDPFAEDELETGRLPKVIDDWLVGQIEAGKDTEAIRKLLHMSEPEKEEFLKNATNDPSAVPIDMPPPLALSLKVKYPDIYNRYRKLKGPIKATKPLKTRRGGVGVSLGASSQPNDDSLTEDDVKDPVPTDVSAGDMRGVDHQYTLGPEEDAQMTDQLAMLASEGHGDLAQALLRLPRGGQEGEQVHLDESMLRMAAAAAEEGQEEKVETAWEAMHT